MNAIHQIQDTSLGRYLAERFSSLHSPGYSSTIKTVLQHVLQARATLAVRKLAISKARLNLLKRRPLGFNFTLEREGESGRDREEESKTV